MQYVSAADAKEKLPALLDTAQNEPVMIRDADRDLAVMLSPLEYERLRGENIAAFETFCERVSHNAQAKGLTEEKLDELLEK